MYKKMLHTFKGLACLCRTVRRFHIQRRAAMSISHIAVLPGLEPLEQRTLLSATFIVDTALDVVDGGDGLLSLREALQEASILPGDDIIQFDSGLSGQVIYLQGASPLQVDSDVSIEGLGSANLTLDGQVGSGVIHVVGSVTVTISDLQITNGSTLNSGGGILNEDADLTLVDCVVHANHADQNGGGIANLGGDIQLSNVTVSDNTADSGSGVYNAVGTVSIDTNSTLSGNDATQDGGGIYNADTLNISNASIAENTAANSGAGIYNTGLATIDQLSLHNNDAIVYGGGIYNNGSSLLDLSNITVSGCHAEAGGGMYNQGTTVVDNSLFMGNVTDVIGVGGGGGIYNHVTGSVMLNNVELNGNHSLFHGGGVYNAGELTIIGSIFDDNSSSGDKGGGIYNAIDADLVITGSTFMNGSANKGGGIASGGEMNANNITVTGNTASDGAGLSLWNSSINLSNSIISNNVAEWNGGGIYNDAFLTVTNATFAGNSAEEWGGGAIHNANTLSLNNATLSGNSAGGHGGGIHNQGTLTVTNSTITLNTADANDDAYGNAGGIYGYDATLYNTIVAQNVIGLTAPVADDVKHDFDPASSNNLIGVVDGSTGFVDGVNGNKVGTSAIPLDPMMGALADNGGTMLTHMLLAGSPAIDSGANSWSDAVGLITDQRSFDRLYDGDGDLAVVVDIGAVEYGATTYSPWQVTDIGGASTAGSYTVYDNVITVNGAGADIWGESDEFCYMYQQVEGDVDIIARVTTLQNTDDWAKAGLMIRQSLDADSANAMIAILPEMGMNFQVREEAAQSTTNVGASGKIPMWLRLNRSGDTFTAYAYYNGLNWTQIATQTIDMSENIYVGMAVASHDNGILAGATLENVYVTENILSESTLVDDADIAVTYTGTWDAREGLGGRLNETTHESDEAVASVEYTFTGTGISLIAEQQPWGGSADIYLDDELQGTASFYADLPDQFQQEVFSISGLVAGTYTIRIENTGGNWGYIDALHVFNEAPASPTGLIAVAGDDYIDLDWLDNQESDIVYYNIYRSLTLEGNYGQIAGQIIDSQYHDTNVQDGEDYYYLVTAIDAWGNESYHSGKAGNIVGDLVVSLAIDEFDGGYQPADLSLREAIYLSLINPGDEVITFSGNLQGQTIALGQALNQLEIYSNITIEGPGADQLTIDAGGNHRVLYVGQNVDVTLTGLTLSNGGMSGQGGAIYNDGSGLNISDVWISDCSASEGGGIYNASGNLVIVDSTLSGNDSQSSGGGIYSSGGSLTIKNTTISGNTSGDTGGGIYTDATPATLTNVTVTANTATTNGSGMAIISGSVILQNTIVAGNVSDNIAGSIDVASSHNVIDVDPMLGPLADNSGSTLTHALLAGSPAINSGNDGYAVAAGLTTDQRGFNRFVGAVDIGAYESDVQGPTPPTNLAATPGDGRLTLNWDHSSSGDVLYYIVYRAEVTGGPYQAVAIAFLGDNIIDSNVYNDVTYYYVLVAVNTSAQQSTYSEEVSATPTSGAPESSPVTADQPVYQLTATSQDQPVADSPVRTHEGKRPGRKTIHNKPVLMWSNHVKRQIKTTYRGDTTSLTSLLQDSSDPTNDLIDVLNLL